MADKTERKLCPKGHECPELKQIIRTLDLHESDVLNAYIVGSHLWGTCHKHSDWDLVIVVGKLASHKPLNLHKGQIEAFILSKSDYVEQIQDHSMQVLVTLWVPDVFILTEHMDPKVLFCFNKSALLKSLAHTKDRDLRVAEKHFRKSDSKLSKKVLLHCIRYLCLATQVKTMGCIQEYEAGYDHRRVVMDDYSKSWEELLSTVRPIIDELWAALQT